MTHKEIAKILGLNTEQVKTIERAAIRKLKRSAKMRELANERS
jgi:DNA-directed RNA polymerase sigma subunit (sigma70/sigma32)